MKITKRQLQGVIAESINRVLREEVKNSDNNELSVQMIALIFNTMPNRSDDELRSFIDGYFYEYGYGTPEVRELFRDAASAELAKRDKEFAKKYFDRRFSLKKNFNGKLQTKDEFDKNQEYYKKQETDMAWDKHEKDELRNRFDSAWEDTISGTEADKHPLHKKNSLNRIVKESINRVLNEVGDTPNGQRKLGALAARKKEQGDDDAFHDTIRYASKAAAKKGDIYMGEPYFSDGFVSYKYPNCPNHNKGRKPLKEGFYEKDGTYYAQCWEDVYEWEKNTHIPKDKVDAVMVLIRNLDGEYYRNAKIEEETIQLLNRGGVWWGVSKGLIIEEHLSNNEERNTFFESMQDLGFVVTDRYTDGSSYSYERTNYIEFSYKPLICRFGFKG